MAATIVKRKMCIKAFPSSSCVSEYAIPVSSTREEISHTINHHIKLFETLARKIKKNGETDANAKAAYLAPAKYATLRECLRVYYDPKIMKYRHDRDTHLMLHIRAVKAMQIILTINPVSKLGIVPQGMGAGWETRLKDLETELYDDDE